MSKPILMAMLLVSLLQASGGQQATIVDSGSTNIPGMTVTMGAKGRALVEHNRGGQRLRMNVSEELRTRLMKDLEAAVPLDQLNARHCVKSVSFGSRLYVEYKGVRSPDLSCPGQSDPKVEALRTDAEEIMAEARRKQ